MEYVFCFVCADQSQDDPSIGNIVSMIRSIKTLREDMSAKKRFGVTRAKISFNELLGNIHEEVETFLRIANA